MKYIFNKTVFILLLFISSICLYSCESNPCITRHVVCQNTGICNDGICVCPVGYEGDSCQFKVNQKFGGNYAGISTILINNTTRFDNDDTLIVTPQTDKYKVKIASIRDTNNFFYADVNESYLYIRNQNTLNGYAVNGSGSLSGKYLTISAISDSIVGGSSVKNIISTFVGYKY